MLFLVLACTPEEKESKKPVTPEESVPVVDSDTAPVVRCEESAGGVVDEGAYSWQGWDNGSARRTMGDFGDFTGQDGNTYNLADTPGYEAVRFEFDHPARVYALKVMFGQLPAEQIPVEISIFPDFGHNGFDYNIEAPLWTGTRCLDASGEGGWVTYQLETPLEFAGPGLLYVANYRENAQGVMLSMDGDYVDDGSCANWDDCHSAIRYPNASTDYLYVGESFPWPYDFLVQLQYEYTYQTPEEDLWFHQNDAAGLPPTSNISWGDFDDDGDDDIMLAGPYLYRNDGGVFTDVTDASGVQASGLGTAGGVWGDFDNDGCLDYYGMNPSRASDDSANELLLRSNCDGTFSDVTAIAGIDDLQDTVDCLEEGTPQHSPTYGASWADFDSDGLLDLVQANFLCFDDYTYYPDRFWRNNGDGTFTEWGADHGFEWDAYAGRGVVALDADIDGDIDISINNYTLQRNLYYENLGGGQFEESAADHGLAGYGVFGAFGHTIGMAWGDLDNDGDWDSVHANLAHPRYYNFSDLTMLLLNDGSGKWSDYAEANGISYHETHSNPSLLDFENDGDLDLTITEVYPGRPTDVYVNDGAALFASSREAAGITTENGWGSAVSDYDNDGDVDLLASYLFRNDLGGGHYVKLRLVGDVASNRAAIGATAWVTAGGVTRMAFVSGGNGVGNQDSQTLTIGLGETTSIERVEVWFPGGETVSYSGLEVDKSYRLTESGQVFEGLGAPAR